MKNLFIFALLVLSACDGTSPKPVMLIGDSISFGYLPYVRDELSQHYAVYHAAGGTKYSEDYGNDRSSTYFLANMDRIMADAGNPDVIHANWGVWDLVRRTEQGTCESKKLAPYTSQEKFRSNLEAIATGFEARGYIGHRVILATITPVPDNKCIISADVPIYNAIIKDVANEHGFGVDDLYTLMLPYPQLHLNKSGAHFKPEGYQLMSYQVSQSIEHTD